jgi:signal transduction histidine kinase
VRFEGRESDHEVATMRFGARDFAATFASYLVNAAALFCVGALALVFRPDLPAARALAISTAILGGLLVLAVDYVSAYRMVALCRLAEALAPASLVNLGLVFPTERGSTRMRVAVVGAVALVGLAGQAYAHAVFDERPELTRDVAVGLYIGVALALLGLVATASETLIRADTALARARAAAVLAGWLPAFAMAAFGMLTFTLLGWSFSWTWVFVLLPLAPAATLYAMVRHDLLDAERFARLTAGYTLATAGVIVLYASGLALLDWAVVSGAAANPAASFLMILLVALLFDPIRRRLQAIVDRGFYRSKLDAAGELEDSGEILLRLPSESAIRAEVTDRLQRALRLDFAELREPGDRRPSDALVQEVASHGEALALLACGPKRSAASFSDEERDFVRGLAAQTALALRNARALQDLAETERALRTSERLAAVGRFAGAVAHGLRNPLAAIRIAAQAGAGAADPESSRRSLETVVSEVDRLERRVRSLLRYSRPPEPERRVADLRGIVHDVETPLRALAGRARIELELQLPEDSLCAYVDPAFVREAVLELASNAVSATPEQGRLVLALCEEGPDAVLRVEDTGPGIPEELRARVFELFFTTRADGTGFGLANVRKIAEANAGTVELERSGATGTCFSLRFARV